MKEYEATIYKSSNFVDRIRIAVIDKLPSIPRSFELDEESVYLGLGCGYSRKEQNEASGNIYRLIRQKD